MIGLGNLHRRRVVEDNTPTDLVYSAHKLVDEAQTSFEMRNNLGQTFDIGFNGCLLYTSPSPRDQRGSRMPSSA